MKSTVELLAPAGSYDAFIAAVENGANAVYLGGKLFNARANASNFDLDELKKIVEYAHLRNVKIHLTLNTLLNDSELKPALEFAFEIYKIGVDAVIVQDLGLAKILHEYIPNLPLHASTQLSTHSLEGVEELAKIGFSRVVLARELSIEEIKYICENTKTEIEIFAHGAQCICYSGQCLMSSMIGDRSGNRGKCAQPCRLPYELIKKNTNGNNSNLGEDYLLSPKDLSTLNILKELPNVACLKIEGRMKSPEYVATVTSIYRKYLDNLESKVSKDDDTNLKQIFNRGGFSNAYLKEKTGKDVMCYEKPKNWGIYIGTVIKYDGKNEIEITNENNVDLINGDGIEIWNDENESPSSIISSVEKLKNGNYKISRIHGNINAGNKVYRTSSKELNAKAIESFSRGFNRHNKVDCKIYAYTSKPLSMVIGDFLYVSNIKPEKALKAPITKEKFVEQISKTGNTPFEFGNFKVEMEDDIFLSISSINEFRRCALKEYEGFLLKNDEKNFDEIKAQIDNYEVIKNKNSLINEKEVSILLNVFNDDCLSLKNVNNYYINFKDSIKNIDIIQKIQGKKYLVFPNITKANYDKLIKNNIADLSKYFDGFVLSNIGQLQYVNDYLNNKELIANYTFNTFNTETIILLKELGFSKVILSQELTKEQINHVASNAISLGVKVEVIAYGNTCVMTSEYCPIGSIVGGFCKEKACSKPCLKNEKYYLKDRLNMLFRVISDNIDCQSRIYNCKTTSIETDSLNVDSIRLDFIDENIEEISDIITIHKNGKKMSGENYTNGHYFRPV